MSDFDREEPTPTVPPDALTLKRIWDMLQDRHDDLMARLERAERSERTAWLAGGLATASFVLAVVAIVLVRT